jgi:hypothetical protein
VETLRAVVIASLHPVDEVDERCYPQVALKSTAQPARFLYEEAADPEEFFVPHAWRICIHTSSVDICWYLDRVSLFDVTSAGLVDTVSLNCNDGKEMHPRGHTEGFKSTQSTSYSDNLDLRAGSDMV